MAKAEKEVRFDFEKKFAENSKNEIYFSNPTGLGYQGIILPNKLLKIKRIIKFGLLKGSADYIGIEKIKITKDMVGEEIGVFSAVEIKTKTGKQNEDQSRFQMLVEKYKGKYKIWSDQ